MILFFFILYNCVRDSILPCWTNMLAITDTSNKCIWLYCFKVFALQMLGLSNKVVKRYHCLKPMTIIKTNIVSVFALTWNAFYQTIIRFLPGQFSSSNLFLQSYSPLHSRWGSRHWPFIQLKWLSGQQSSSSRLDGQSIWPSHTQDIGIHWPPPHENSSNIAKQ